MPTFQMMRANHGQIKPRFHLAWRSTSDPFPSNPSRQAGKPVKVRLGFSECDRMPFLQHLMHRDEGLEGLNLVRQDWLPKRCPCSATAQGTARAVHRHFHAGPERL